MLNVLLVAIGGAAGASLRYGVSVLAPFRPDAGWPTATLTVNLIGSLLMGMVAGWAASRAGAGQETIRAFLGAGVLGGFTTFSAFSLETMTLIERGRLTAAGLYVLVSLVFGVGALAVGLMAARKVFA